MKRVNLTIISLETARSQLVDLYVNILTSDANHTRDLITMPRGIGAAIPAVSSLPPEKIVELYGELNLADAILDKNPAVQAVGIQLSPGGNVSIVAERKGVERLQKLTPYALNFLCNNLDTSILYNMNRIFGERTREEWEDTIRRMVDTKDD
jgi:hypothetical protein